MSLPIIILPNCEKELKKFPKEILEDFLDAVARLKMGFNLSMPLSRPMPSIGANVHELRLRDRSGIYRIIYVIKTKDGIYVIHAFPKKTQETPKKNIRLAKERLKELL